MANLRYLACTKCESPVRVDDGSYQNDRGEVCQHYGARLRQHNCESSMVIFRSPNGKISIPWQPDAPCPKGYRREEIHGANNVRHLERELDARDIARHEKFQLKR